MGLRLKTAATVTTIFAALLGAIYLLFSEVILGEFEKIEKNQAAVGLSRVIDAVKGVGDDLESRAVEWSHSDDALAFIRSPHRDFIHTHFEQSSFDFQDLVFLNSRGEVVFAGRLDKTSERFIPLPERDKELILQEAPLHELISTKKLKSFSGVIRDGKSPLIVAASALSGTSAVEHPLGALIFTTRLSADVKSKVSSLNRTEVSFDLLPLLNANAPEPRDGNSSRTQISADATRISAVGIIADLKDRPLLRVALSIPREIYSQGRLALNNTVLLITAFLVVANGVILLFLNRAVLNPLRRVSMVMAQIAHTNNLSLRVLANRHDELGVLGRSFNQLLDSTEASYQKMLEARNEAQTANSGKSLFIAKVSHELRTPIHGITGMLRILMKQETNSGKRSYIQMAQASAKGLLETINEILDFSKMETGSLALEQVEFDLVQTIRETVSQLIPRFEEKPDVELFWNIAPNIPSRVVGDPLRIKNILTNLLGNAFKFTDAGHVSLTVTGYEGPLHDRVGIKFQVQDTGIGIPSNRLKEIFDPFTQADESTARLYAGTGLGLAIVKQVTEHMGGSVSAESVIGKGSIFSVFAPFKQCPRQDPSKNHTADNITPHRVAIFAEDSAGLRALAAGLEAFNCSVTHFSPENASALPDLIDSITSYDVIHISGYRDILIDEIRPLIRIATRFEIPVVMAVRPSDMAAMDMITSSERFLLSHKPISALDLLLLAEGKISPSATTVNDDEDQMRSEHHLNILVADDAATNRIILKNLLEEAGHTVELVENGKQLVERLIQVKQGETVGARPLDVVMTDIQMPVMDGLTAAQCVRDYEKEAEDVHKIPIVAVTAYAFPEECVKMRASGIDHIITKPISPKRLSRLLSQITCETTEVASPDHETDTETIQELTRITEKFRQQISETIVPASSERSSLELPALDINGVYERSGNSLRRTGLILSGFLESYQKPTETLFNARLPLIDPPGFRRVIHSLKGLLLDVGASHAAELAGSIERTIVEAPDSLTMETCHALLDEIRIIASLLEDLVAALPSIEVFAALPALDDDHQLLQ
jgi:signal transduction histidine kinase/CheY-like chemotaxis protein